MPYTWFSFSTATAEDLRGQSPTQIRDVIESIAEERRGAGAETTVVGVFFDIGKEVGYALFKDVGDSKEIKKVSRRIGAIGATKMLDPDQAEEVW